jgi:hypothetical protein
MTPAHGNDSARGDSQEFSPTDPSTVPIRLPRTRRTQRLRGLRFALRHPRPARPTTVWPCAQHDVREGTGLLSNWLLTAVVKIVVTYTQPGQRVLLLEPSPYFAPPGPRATNDGRSQSRPGPYAGLHEAAWTVVRLGRGVQTHAAISHPDPAGEQPAAESESGLRRAVGSPTNDQFAGPSTDRNVGPDPTATSFGPDRYDLVIAAAEPRTLGWFQPADSVSSLAPTGTLAVITHGDRSSDRLVDPAGSLVRAAHRAGLCYVDRIALLRASVRDSALVVAAPTTHARAQTPMPSLGPYVRHAQVHDDLLVFTRQPALIAAGDGEEGSDA